MSEELTWDEYRGWELYHRRYPFDPESSDQLPAAQVSAAIQNANGGRNGQPVSLFDNLMFRPVEIDVDESLRSNNW